MAGLQTILAALQQGGQPLGNIARANSLVPNVPASMLPTAPNRPLDQTAAAQGAPFATQTVGANPLDALAQLKPQTSQYLNTAPNMQAIMRALGIQS